VVNRLQHGNTGVHVKNRGPLGVPPALGPPLRRRILWDWRRSFAARKLLVRLFQLTALTRRLRVVFLLDKLFRARA